MGNGRACCCIKKVIKLLAFLTFNTAFVFDTIEDVLRWIREAGVVVKVISRLTFLTLILNP